MSTKRRPGQVRDAIFAVLSDRPEGASIAEIEQGVKALLGDAAPSSVRSYLRLNTPALFTRGARGHYSLRESPASLYPASPSESAPHWRSFSVGKVTLCEADCFEWLGVQPQNSVQAVVTDPPYGLFEYTPEQQAKLRNGKGGVWRIPPSFDGAKRSPLPGLQCFPIKTSAS